MRTEQGGCVGNVERLYGIVWYGQTACVGIKGKHVRCAYARDRSWQSITSQPASQPVRKEQERGRKERGDYQFVTLQGMMMTS